MRPLVLAAVCLAIAGCSSGTGGERAAPAPRGSPIACEPGQRRVADTCIAAAAAACDKGSMPVLGRDTCEPVGSWACARGFEREPRGWGCAPRFQATCSQGTRAPLGALECADVGDCGAEFPPSEATLFVGPSLTPDATHFRTIGAALTAAESGATIAIDSGSYGESLRITRSVRLVGRCAREVIVTNDDGKTGVRLVGGSATLRGITVTRSLPGLSVDAGELSIDQVAVDGNVDVGVDVAPGASFIARRSVIRGTASLAGQRGYGLLLLAGGATLDDTEVSGNAGDAVAGGGAAATLDITGSIIFGSETTDGGSGIVVERGAKARIARSLVSDHVRFGVIAMSGAEVELEDAVFARTRAGRNKAGLGIVVNDAKLRGARVTSVDHEGAAVAATNAAEVTLEDTVLAFQRTTPTQSMGVGAYFFGGARLRLSRSALIANRAGGVEAWQRGTSVELDRSLVAETDGVDDGQYGYGLLVSDGVAKVSDSALVGNRQAGIHVAIGGTLEAARTLIRASRPERFEDRLGHGVMALDAARVSIVGALIETSAGTGVAAANSRVLLGSSVLLGNPVALHAQEGSVIREVAELPQVGSSPDVFVTTDTRFVDNGVRVGTGQLSLPPPPKPSL